jgi:hypothetical protein
MAFERAVVRRRALVAVALVAMVGATGLSACASRNKAPPADGAASRGGFLGLFGRRQAPAQQPGGVIVGVNAYLWRASLDTLAFMPLSSADPYTGIIITDWYSPPEQPNERFKATVYILDTRLRADGLNVSLHRQTRAGTEWRDAPTAVETEEALENQILTRARQIRTSGR